MHQLHILHWPNCLQCLLSGLQGELLLALAFVLVAFFQLIRLFTPPLLSQNCTVMAVLQQFRARDCKNFTTALFTQTDPVIETSKDMKFGCYNTGYTKLAGKSVHTAATPHTCLLNQSLCMAFAWVVPEHMDGAGLSVWENKWRDVFDFNAANGVGHFKLLTTVR